MLEPVADYTVVSAVLCDEVRIENNGKYLLIGVYSGGIVLDRLPLTFGVSAYIEAALPAGTTKIEISCTLGEAELAEITVEVEVPEAGIHGVATPRFGANVASPQNLCIAVGFNGGEKREVQRRPIIVVPGLGGIPAVPIAE